MATNEVCDWSTLHDLSVHQQRQHGRRCVDCQKLKNELTEVRLELKSVKEIVNLLNQDLASSSVYEHNLLGEEPPKSIDTPWENPRHSTKTSFSESTVRNSFFNTNNRFQVLDKLQESDSIVVTPSETLQTGKVHKNITNTRRTCQQEEDQIPKVISSTNPSNIDSLERESQNYQPIPVIVNGSTTARKNTPTKRHSKTTANKKDHKLLIIGDSHARRWAQNVKAQIKNNFHIQGLIKPGAGADILETTAKSDITSQSKKDVVVVCVGANDIAKNNTKIALNHISNFVKSNNHTNIIVTNLPHRFDLPQSSCVNSEISSFNRKLIKNMKLYNHASILEMCNKRKFFTNHGLHLNGLGKEVMAEKIASHTLTVLNQKKNPPIVVSWNSEKATIVTQLERASNTTPIKTKETPENTTSANVCNGVSILRKDNTWVDDIGIPVQNGICNTSDENTDNKEAFHQSQLQPSNSQAAIRETEEMKTQHLEQNKALCKVSSRLKKPVIKSDDFLW